MLASARVASCRLVLDRSLGMAGALAGSEICESTKGRAVICLMAGAGAGSEFCEFTGGLAMVCLGMAGAGAGSEFCGSSEGHATICLESVADALAQG